MPGDFTNSSLYFTLSFARNQIISFSIHAIYGLQECKKDGNKNVKND